MTQARARRARAAAIVLCCALSSAAADGLDALFDALRMAPSTEAAAEIEARIWAQWSHSGDERVDALLAKGTAAMQAGALDAAVETFTRVIEARPGFAEGWNKRATALFLMDELERSVEDIERTLALEPRHFGAIPGMGLIFLERGDLIGALGAFEQVLVIHPRSAPARANATRIRARLRDRAA